MLISLPVMTREIKNNTLGISNIKILKAIKLITKSGLNILVL